MWYKTNAPTSPKRPSADRDPKIPITFSTTEMFGQNGIATPLNSTSKTIPRAITLIPTSVILLTHRPTLFNKSIIKI